MKKVFVLMAGVISLATAPVQAVRIDLVSTRATNSPAPLGEVLGVELSADGKWAALTVSDDSPDRLRYSSDVFLRNLATGEDILASRSATDPLGSRGNDSSVATALSSDGRFVLFDSDASDLVAGDTNEASDVFLFDRVSGQVLLVSGVSGAPSGFGDGDSTTLDMSPDGRFILFESEADNLVENDLNDSPDIFLFDRQTGQTKLVTENYDNSGSAAGALRGQALGGRVSSDGRYVVFLSSATNHVKFSQGIVDSQVYLRDMQRGVNTWLNRQDDGNGGRYASSPRISTNGVYSAFITADLVIGPASIFPSTFLCAYDNSGSVEMRYSKPPQIAQVELHNVKSFAMTPDGTRMVAAVEYGFPYEGTLSGLEIYDNEARTNGLLTLSATVAQPRGSFADPLISPDGTQVFFTITSNSPDLPGGTGQEMKLYERNLLRGSTELLSGSGVPGDVFEPRIAADGTLAAFTSSGGDSSDPDNQSLTAYIIRPGFIEPSQKLVVLDPRGVAASGDGASTFSPYFGDPARTLHPLSSDGRMAVFSSLANNLVPSDTNAHADIFVRDLQQQQTRMINVLPNGGGIGTNASFIGISADGTRVAWEAATPKLRYRGTVFIYNTTSGLNDPASVLPDGSVTASASPYAALSTDGRYLLFADFSPTSYDLYVRDLQESKDTLVKTRSPNPWTTLSSGGKYVIFYDNIGGYPSQLIDWRNHITNYFAGYPLGGSSDDTVSLWLANNQSLDLYLYYPALNSSNLGFLAVFSGMGF